MNDYKKLIDDTAKNILQNFQQWQREADELCQCYQSDEPYKYHMMQKLTEVINTSLNLHRVMLRREDIL